MSDAIFDLKFDKNDYENLPTEKQSVILFTWLSEITENIRKCTSAPGSELQHYVSTELSAMIDYFAKQKEQPVFTKANRNAIGRLYQLLYTSESSKDLYEVTNKMLGFLNKNDKYTELKQYVLLLLF